MQNLSWLFYKGYFKGFEHWNNYKPSSETEKKSVIAFFSDKNKIFTTVKFESFLTIDVDALPKNSSFSLFTSYPGLLLGSGYNHGIGAAGEFKIGFHLDYLTGLPSVPGSSVKGILRSVFPIIKLNKTSLKYEYNSESKEMEMTKAKWIAGLIEELSKPNLNEEEFLRKYIPPSEVNVEDKIEYFNELVSEIFEGVKNISSLDPSEKFNSIYKRNIFFDAHPISSKHTGNLVYGDDSITPHIKENLSYEESMLKNPTPLLFLKVLPNIEYNFNFKLFESKKEPMLTKGKLELLFKKILLTIGLGAKTNVGYGQFTSTITDLVPSTNPDIKGESRNNNKSERNFFLKGQNTFKKNDEVKAKLIIIGEELTFETENGCQFHKRKDVVLKKFEDISKRKNKEHKELELNETYTISVNDDIRLDTELANFSVKPIFK